MAIINPTFAFFLLNEEHDSHLFPQPNHDSVNNDFDECANLLATLCHEENPRHSVQWYRDRVIACDICRDSLGWQNAVTCIANSGESPYGLSTHNAIMHDGSEYLYLTDDGTYVIANISDDYGDSYYRVHKF